VIAIIRRGILQRGIFATPSANRSVEMPKTQLLNTVAVPESRRVKLFDLQFNSCRFPIGDPRDAEFSFCGQPAPGFGVNPYCPTHQKIAFAKATGPSQHKSAAARLAWRKGHAQSA
jgi:GcrA cell cycle regulator